MNPTISLAMIVRDEESCLARCLDSIKDLVNEIVIVDTGSVDKTKEIALRYTDKVFDFEWINDFSAARNYSFSKCTQDFIFWVDADDELSSVNAKRFRELDLTNIDVVIFDYNYAFDEWGNCIRRVGRERLIRRSLGLKWDQPIHESIYIGGTRIYKAPIAIDHFKKHCTSKRNIEILRANVCADDGTIRPEANTRNVYYMGKEYVEANQTDEAIPFLEETVKRGDGFWEDRYAAWHKLAEIYLIKNDVDKFKRCWLESIFIESRRAEPYYLMGTYYFDQKSYLLAIHWYKMCLAVERPPDLLGTFDEGYHKWRPALQLVACYNNIGDMRKAHEYNELALKFNPKDNRALNNKRILDSLIKGDVYRRDGQRKRLNLGCGNKPMEGYVNVDLFDGPIVDEIFGIDYIPYKEGTIAAIHSEHALEHLPMVRTKEVLEEWFRVLEPNGELWLKIPDMELCCRGYLNAPMDGDFFIKKQWFKYTIYGIQKSQAGEPDEAQFHQAGYSKEEIKRLLEEVGFKITKLENYDGWHTPSVEVKAIKPAQTVRIGWICGTDRTAAQGRIRVLNINDWLQSRGYQSDVVSYTDVISKNYDVAVIGKSFSKTDYEQIKHLKDKNKYIITDLCEDIIDLPWVKDILMASDKIVCCSYELEKRVKAINPETVVIEDAWEK